MAMRRNAGAKSKAAGNAAATVPEEPPPPPTECEKQGKGCRWVVASPSGPEAPGKCKVCGAERMFRNSFEYSSWYGTKNTSGRRPGRPPGRPKKSTTT